MAPYESDGQPPTFCRHRCLHIDPYQHPMARVGLRSCHSPDNPQAVTPVFSTLDATPSRLLIVGYDGLIISILAEEASDTRGEYMLVPFQYTDQFRWFIM